MVYVSHEEGRLECRCLSSERVLSSAYLYARRQIGAVFVVLTWLDEHPSAKVQRDVWDAGRYARATCCTAADGGEPIGLQLRTLSVVYGTSRAAATSPSDCRLSRKMPSCSHCSSVMKSRGRCLHGPEDRRPTRLCQQWKPRGRRGSVPHQPHVEHPAAKRETVGRCSNSPTRR
jgi:hypothetical protein